VAYSAPDALAGTEGPLEVHGEWKETKREEEKARMERIGRNRKKRPKINFLLSPCPYFPKQKLKSH